MSHESGKPLGFPPASVAACKHVEGADDVRVDGVILVLDGTDDARLCRQVVDRARIAESFGNGRRVADVTVNEIETRFRSSIGEVLRSTTVQVGQDNDVCAAILEQAVDEVITYETGAAWGRRSFLDSGAHMEDCRAGTGASWSPVEIPLRSLLDLRFPTGLRISVSRGGPEAMTCQASCWRARGVRAQTQRLLNG